jgi:hypothetical protein
MLLNHLSRSRKPRPPVKPFARPSRWNAAVLRLEALDERVVPSFAEPTIYPVGPGANSLAAADFTGDGILDLATNGGVLVGNGDGSFQPARLSPMLGESLLAGDMDGDGKADLITTGGGNLNVLISNGDGTFRPAQPVTLPPATPPGYGGEPWTGEPLPQSIASAVVGDLNADGLLDLVVTGYTSYTVANDDPYGPGGISVTTKFANVLIGTGLGTFDHTAAYVLGQSRSYYLPVTLLYGPDVGDFNGDGNLDFLTSTFIDNGAYADPFSYLETWLGNGDGTFQSPRVTSGYWGDGRFVQNAVADFNRDGRTDVLIDGEAYSTTATVALANVDGSFTPMSQFNIGVHLDRYWVTPVVGDINGDGKSDMLFVNGESGNGSSIVLGNGDGTFANPIPYDFGPGTYALQDHRLADFNGDGLADLASADRFAGVVVHMNAGGWSTPRLQIISAGMTEGNSGTTAMTFTVSLIQAATGPVTVQYATADGTAAAGSDYQAASGTLSFARGETQKTITVAVLGDQLFEPNEWFAVTLSNPTGALLAVAGASGVILNDDTESPSISITDVARKEGRSGTTLFVFTVTLSAPSVSQVTVRYTTADGTAKAGEDYTAASGTLTFAPGETMKTVTIKVKGDRAKEADETFSLILSGATNASILDGTGLGTILNDD